MPISRHPQIERFVAACAVLWSLLFSPSAHATPLFELSGSIGDQGGLQGRNGANGASAAYFNPALLVDAPAGVTFGVVVLHTSYNIDVAPRTEPRADVPNDLENAAHADGSRFESYPLGTDVLQHGRVVSANHPATTARPRQAAGDGRPTQTYEAVGLVAAFFERRLTLGVYGLIPNKNLARLTASYADEREQYVSNSLHPELFGDRTSALSFAMGAGYRISDSFSLGVGGTLSVQATARTPAFVADASKLQNLVLDMDAKAIVGFAPHGGFAWNPHPRWRITGTLHAPQKLDIAAKVDFLLVSGLQQSSTLHFVFDWMPWQASLGTSVDVIRRAEKTVTLSASGLYGRWSSYVDRHGERPLPGLAWQDTITPALGVRASVRDFRVGLDLQYKPTPVPQQFGRSNYVDNDRVSSSLNTDYAFHVLDTTVRLGLSAQVGWMLVRSVRKLTTPTYPDGINRTPSLVQDELPDDAQIGGTRVAGAKGLQTNNPGWPGFSSGGWLAMAGLYLSVSL